MNRIERIEKNMFELATFVKDIVVKEGSLDPPFAVCLNKEGKGEIVEFEFLDDYEQKKVEMMKLALYCKMKRYIGVMTAQEVWIKAMDKGERPSGPIREMEGKREAIMLLGVVRGATISLLWFFTRDEDDGVVFQEARGACSIYDKKSGVTGISDPLVAVFNENEEN